MRLFVAINLPDTVKEPLHELKTEIPTARWVKIKNMHLTLRFIGEVEDDSVDALKSQLETIDAPAFELTLSGIGQFPKKQTNPPRILWIGFEQEPALNQLQKQIETQIRELGYEANNKLFRPHLTLARLKSNKLLPEATQFLEQHHDLKLNTFSVGEFHLYSSKLSSSGPEYTREATYPLNEEVE